MEESNNQQMDIKDEYEVVTIDDSEEETEKNECKPTAQDFSDLFKHESIDISSEYSTNCFCYGCGSYSNNHSAYENECLFEHKHQITSFYPQQLQQTYPSYKEYIQHNYLPPYPESDGQLQYYKNEKDTFSELLHKSITENFVCNSRKQEEFSSDLSRIKICNSISIRSDNNFEQSTTTEINFNKNNELYSQISTQNLKKCETSSCHIASFACPFCPKMFLTKILLTGHTQYECENKKIVCMKCHTRFTTNTHLMRHQMSKMCNVKPFECVGCKNRYASKKYVKRHQLNCTAYLDMHRSRPSSILCDRLLNETLLMPRADHMGPASSGTDYSMSIC